MKLASGAYISEVARGGVSKPVRTCFDRGLLEQVACSSCIAGWPHSCHFVDVPCWTQPRGRECWPQLFGPGSSFKTDFVWADQQRVWLATWWNTILRRWMLRFKVVASNLQSELSYIRYRCVTNAVCPLLLSKAHTEGPGCLRLLDSTCLMSHTHEFIANGKKPL